MSYLEQLRVKANISQQKVAKQVGIATSTYCMYEQGKRDVSKEKAIKIAEAVGCKIEEIFLPSKFTVSEFNGESLPS